MQALRHLRRACHMFTRGAYHIFRRGAYHILGSMPGAMQLILSANTSDQNLASGDLNTYRQTWFKGLKGGSLTTNDAAIYIRSLCGASLTAVECKPSGARAVSRDHAGVVPGIAEHSSNARTIQRCSSACIAYATRRCCSKRTVP